MRAREQYHPGCHLDVFSDVSSIRVDNLYTRFHQRLKHFPTLYDIKFGMDSIVRRVHLSPVEMIRHSEKLDQEVRS